MAGVEHTPSLVQFIRPVLFDEKTLEQKVLSCLADLICTIPPILPEKVPQCLSSSFAELQVLQVEANHSLRCLVMKVSLEMSLMHQVKQPIRERVSSAMATFLAGSEREVEKEKLHSFLMEQFQLYGIALQPITDILTNSDILLSFGHIRIFQSSIADYIYEMAIAHYDMPDVPLSQLESDFAEQGPRVGSEFLHQLVLVSSSLSHIVLSNLSAVKEEFQSFMPRA